MLREFNPSAVYDGQKHCRSIIDAVEMLRELNGNLTPSSISVFAKRIRRPDGVETAIVLLESRIKGQAKFIRLPNCTHVQARTTDGTTLSFDVSALNEGIIDDSGVVTLANGRSIHNVTFKPEKPVLYKFSELDDVIARHALLLLHRYEDCCSAISLELGVVSILDYAKLRDVEVSDLKQLLHRIKMSCFPSVTEPRIMLALRRAGFQFPRS